MEKQHIRQRILHRLANQKEDLRLKKSLKIKKALFALPEFIRARTVFFYVAFGGEVETAGMIVDALCLGKKVAVPIIESGKTNMSASLLQTFTGELVPGPWGILQPKPECVRPIPVQELDAVVVPGVAFDSAGNRLGRGAGFFDRFLACLSSDTIPRIGLSFSFQRVKRLPVFSHDVAMTTVISA